MFDLLIGLCLAIVADTAKLPGGWALPPHVQNACALDPITMMRTAKNGELIWPR